MTRRAFLASILVLASCQGGCPPNTPQPDPVSPHPTPVPTDTEYCDLAEVHLVELHCPEGNPTTRGKRFADVCRELQAAGIAINPKCLANVTSCAEVDVCTGSRAP